MFFGEEADQVDSYPGCGQTGFTPNELEELLPLFELPPSQIPVKAANSPNSGSEGSTRTVYSVDEKRHRRMISNRESARRSRWRKKKYLEKLTVQVNKLGADNRVLKRRLGSVLNQHHALRLENLRLLSESIALRAKLSDLCRILVPMHAMQPPQ